MSRILIIDDDLQICRVLEKLSTRMDHEACYALTLREGLDLLSSERFDIVFLDVNLPDGNGLKAIGRIKGMPFAPEVIIMTGDSDHEGAELAMKSKAWDYIQKSGTHKDFKFSLLRALEYRQQKNSRIHQNKIHREAIVGESRQIKTSLESVSKAANTDISVLITGETGTGKELFAKAIHANSHRKNNDFIVVDCAALPEHLVESVLFGHAKGSFTGAHSDNVGLIKLADRGTLFLDEVGELPLTIQKKFLRALQEKKCRPVGSKSEIASNFRLVAATHRDLPKMVEQGLFREDFYFRIASLLIEIPPLKDRKSDILSLVAHFLNLKEEFSDDVPNRLSEDFMENLIGYNWPGNVRELLNTIDYACSEAYMDSMLFPKHLPDHIRTFNIKRKINEQKQSMPEMPLPVQSAPAAGVKLKVYIEKMKQLYVKDLMSHTNGDIRAACSISGLSRGHLYSLLKKHSLH